MTDINDIKSAVTSSKNWLEERQALHVKRMEQAVYSLQDEIINSMSALGGKAGSLKSIRLNLKTLQEVHKEVINKFYTEFSQEAKDVITDFKSVKGDITRSYAALGESIKFTAVDEDTMKVLRDSAYQQYVTIGGVAQTRVIQSMYNNVIGGKSMSDLVNDITGALTGLKSVTGRPLVNYAKLFANDLIMNFHNDVNLTKGTEIGMEHFLYYGSIMSKSRDFCKRRVGMTYTRKQIDSWTQDWAGKRGPAWTYRGGWNCRHHWQPVRKEWLKGSDPAEMQNWFKEQGLTDKIPKPVTPWGVPAKAAKPTEKAVEAAISTDVPVVPSAESVERTLTEYKSSEEAKVLEAKYKAAKTAYEDYKIKYQEASNEFSKVIGTGKTEKEVEDILNRTRTYGKQSAENRTLAETLKKEMKQKEANAVAKHILPSVTGEAKVRPDVFSLSQNANTRQNELAKFKKLSEEVSAMFHKKVTDAVPMTTVEVRKGARAFYNNGSRKMIISSLSDKDAFVHEFAHAVESNYPGAYQKAVAFRAKRTAGEDLSTIFAGRDEVGWKDEFFSHYCGKKYNFNATEIISMGVEKMYADPIGFLKKDPEYFELILNIMWGNI